MATCSYIPLPQQQDLIKNPPHTRLMLLSPGHDPQPLHCILEPANVDSPPPFEALSYVWGHDFASTPLYCHNGYLPVRTNLDAALRSLRLPTQARRLWVDAICINQQDLSERSRQVQYMRAIYKCATRVIVWLGFKTSGLEDAFVLAAQVAECRRSKDGGHLYPTVHETQSDPIPIESAIPNAVATRNQASGQSETQTAAFDSAFGISGAGNAMAMWVLGQNPESTQHLRDLFSRTYFKRIWCIQEVLVSSWCIAKCEDLEMDFIDLLACCIYLHYSQTTLFTGQTLEFWNFIYCTRTGDAACGKTKGSLGALLICLASSRDFQASDPRDKIFTLFGITDEGLDPSLALMQVMGGEKVQASAKMLHGFFSKLTDRVDNFGPHSDVRRHPALRADYTKDLIEVYRDVTRFMIRMPPRLLAVLSYVAHNDDPSEGSFPSWVPKWFQPRTTSPMTGMYLAGLVSARTGYFSRVHDNPLRGTTQRPGLLQIDGFRIDQVQRIADVMLHQLNHSIQASDIWTQLFPHLPYRFPSNVAYRNGESLETAFFRTLTADALGASLPTITKREQNMRTTTEKMTDHLVTESKLNADAFVRETANRPPNIAIELPASSSAEINAFRAVSAAQPGETASGALLQDPHLERVENWETGARSFSHNRRVYVTRNGYLGLGPRMMQAGDEVCVLYGGRLPFVLRPQADRHVFIGETYLHDEDVMWGKLVDAVDEKRSPVRDETFLLR